MYKNTFHKQLDYQNLSKILQKSKHFSQNLSINEYEKKKKNKLKQF